MYEAILLASLWMSRKDIKTILLLAIVALTYYMPVSRITQDFTYWHLTCIATEATVIFASALLNRAVSIPLIVVTSTLFISHITNWLVPNRFVYPHVACFLEHLQIICFMLTSTIIINKMKRVMQCFLQKFGCGV